MIRPQAPAKGSAAPRYRRATRGFTLVELAVVLAVVAILIASVLKASSVINDAKANDLIAIAGDLSTAARQFRDRYHYLPGDDPKANADLPAPVAPNGDGNGLIDFNASGVMEPNNAANHLVQAGLIRAMTDPVLGTVLKTSFGMVWLMSFQLAAGSGSSGSPCGAAVDSTAPAPSAQNVIVFANLPSALALQIDQKFDDGVFNTGSIRGSAPYSTGANAPPVACFAMPL
jgi:prepilin-type N-terminal cleavage/methylation domain-containing protein